MSTEKRIRFGQVEGRGRGREKLVKKGQYFHRRGGHFAYGASAVLCGSTNWPEYWVESPKHESGTDSWLSITGDKAFCYNDKDDLFEIPICEVAASLAASQVGLVFQLVNTDADRTDEGGGVTATSIQCVRVDNVSATAITNAQVELVDVDIEQSDAKVATVRMIQRVYAY